MIYANVDLMTMCVAWRCLTAIFRRVVYSQIVCIFYYVPTQHNQFIDEENTDDDDDDVVASGSENRTRTDGKKPKNISACRYYIYAVQYTENV